MTKYKSNVYKDGYFELILIVTGKAINSKNNHLSTKRAGVADIVPSMPHSLLFQLM